ncbi:MAG TPA: hypothetical protein VHI53_09830 [Gaiellaceae bacterium]|nr:hypothetical protein [Gaiellaceae bacterium]
MAFFCGVVQHHPESPFAKAGWGWPMSRVDLREGDVHAYTPVLVGRWTLTISYGEIDKAVLRRYGWAGRIRLHRRAGDVTLTTMGGNYVAIANLLREKGVRVTDDERSTDQVA